MKFDNNNETMLLCQPCHLRDWEIHMQFKIFGGCRTLAADGLAIWYTYSRLTPGPVFGSRDEFEGLGIFLDTYKNGDPPVRDFTLQHFSVDI